MQFGLARSGTAVNNVAVATGATQVADVDTSGAQQMTVVTRIRATTTTGDLTVNVAKPYLPADAGSGLIDAVLPVKASSAVAVSNAADVVGVAVYDVTGVQKVQVSAKNNNAGTKNMDIYYFLA